MKESSENNKSSFEGLQLRNIVHLFSVLREAENAIKSLTERRYKEQGTNFERTLSFLIEIDGIHFSEKRFKINPIWDDRLEGYNKKDIIDIILENILLKETAYKRELFSYLTRFKNIDGEIEYRPVDLERTKFSDLRNFLMDSGVVSFNVSSDRYTVSPEYIGLYAQATEANLVCTPEKLLKKLDKKEIIGKAAEKAIFDYEKNRVGPSFEEYIEHISLKNEAAGYDIKSITEIDTNKIEPRYIEVKAVSQVSYKFYWTYNEMRVAEIMRERYFLYLLPVIGEKEFSFNGLKMISNPISEIINSSNDWVVDTNVVCCSLNI